MVSGFIGSIEQSLSSAFSFFQKGNIYIGFVLAAVCNENLMSSWLGCFRLDTGQGVAISKRALLGARPELLHLDFFLHHDSPFPRGSFAVGELRENSRPLSRQGCQAAGPHGWVWCMRQERGRLAEWSDQGTV